MTARTGPPPLPAPYDRMLSAYAAALAGSRLACSSRATYLSRARRFLAWTAGTTAGDARPLAEMTAAVRTARAYRLHLEGGGYARGTIDNHLIAVEDFFARSGLGSTGLRPG
ncbi:hypothetical protein AB0C18_10055 [Nonomuraea muscovyensis]|uniref:hypothetical protein n=1 Tax=Nonomuraea muscovyensis TaxID=1124761 RepID=UPI0033E02CA4